MADSKIKTNFREKGCRKSDRRVEEPTAAPSRDTDTVRQTVRRGYAGIAAGEKDSCCGSAASNVIDAEEFARQMGYSEGELAILPEEANMGLSCGNPTALAELQPGETVLDLGSGGGFDLFIAGRKVGAEGRAIGVDMTPEMIDRARGGIADYRARTGLDNVEFRLGEIEHLPVADASVDAIISNCVVNLSPEKDQVWREISRALKPGGRVAVSDLGLRRPLLAAIREMIEALLGCIAGAVLLSDTERMAREAGLVKIEIEEKSGFLEVMENCQDPLYQKIVALLPKGTHPSDYLVSFNLRARKPS